MEPTRFTKLSCASILTVGIISAAAAQSQDVRRDATDATKQTNSALLKQLPFSDTSDFQNARKGFMAAPPPGVISGSAGNLIWDPKKYGFIKEGDAAPDTVNPSLWRQS
jgi:alkyl sulfatase BDS1-like metallo-beta-lactamase superfamily hydrolase